MRERTAYKIKLPPRPTISHTPKTLCRAQSSDGAQDHPAAGRAFSHEFGIVIFEQASWFIFAVALLWRRENQVAGGEHPIGTIRCGFQRSVQLGYVTAGNAGSTHPARCCTRCSALPLPTLRTSGVSHRIPRPPSFALFFVESWDDGHSVNATAFLFVQGIGVASIFLVSRIVS
jgi:hypothetical protein